MASWQTISLVALFGALLFGVPMAISALRSRGRRVRSADAAPDGKAPRPALVRPLFVLCLLPVTLSLLLSGLVLRPGPGTALWTGWALALIAAIMTLAMPGPSPDA